MIYFLPRHTLMNMDSTIKAPALNMTALHYSVHIKSKQNNGYKFLPNIGIWFVSDPNPIPLFCVLEIHQPQNPKISPM